MRLRTASAACLSVNPSARIVFVNKMIAFAYKVIIIREQVLIFRSFGKNERTVSFKAKAEQVARYIFHQEVLAEARKVEARKIRTLAEQA